MISLQSRIEGLLLGTAVADAIGLPTEGMTPGKIQKLGWTKPLKHRFLFGRGMWSDDTEQTIMLTQALLHSGEDLEKFRRSFAWELRWWILGMPAATGLATARAIIKLWLGFPPSKSGIFSAGNGSAMRTAPIAAYFPDDAEKRQLFTIAQSRITHSDPKASIASLAITELTALFLNSTERTSQDQVIETAAQVSTDREWRSLLEKVSTHARGGQSIAALLADLGASPKKGVSGYVYQTVPAVLLAGLQNDWQFRETITELIAAGGDTDTTAAIAGALCGACHGREGIPQEWLHGVKEWPTTIKQLSSLARSLQHRRKLRVRSRWSPLLLIRNLIFLGTVLSHGLARLVQK